MYLAHFGFTHYPFERALQPDELFASSAAREASARLQHLVELRGIGLITGEVGSGKTTLCRQLCAALHPGLYRLFYVPLSTGNVLDMYKAIAWQLGLPVERNRASAYRAIHSEVSRLVLETKIHPLLVVDEAQHLRNDVLEDLRLLTNYAMDAERRLCLLLVGLPELRRRLSMAVHESLTQRIVVRYHLSGLTREELPAYLSHRLQLAGCTLPLFEPPAIEALFHATQGLPRKVNRAARLTRCPPQRSPRCARSAPSTSSAPSKRSSHEAGGCPGTPACAVPLTTDNDDVQTPNRHRALRAAALERQGGRPTHRAAPPDRPGHRASLRRAGSPLPQASARHRLLPASTGFEPERSSVLIHPARPELNRVAQPPPALLPPPTLLDAVSLSGRSLTQRHEIIWDIRGETIRETTPRRMSAQLNSGKVSAAGWIR
jgi:type II secretory pathway predicted ATPase ExeA